MTKDITTKEECLKLQETKPYYYWKSVCEQNEALKKRTGHDIVCYEKGRMIDDPRPQLFTDKKSCMGSQNRVKDTNGKMKDACRWVEGCHVNT